MAKTRNCSSGGEKFVALLATLESEDLQSPGFQEWLQGIRDTDSNLPPEAKAEIDKIIGERQER